MRKLMAFTAVGLLVSLAACSDDDGSEKGDDSTSARTVTVTHPEVQPPTLLDLGDEGPSVGDVRVFHLDATADDGSAVTVEFLMTTTAVDTPEVGVQTRVATGVFSFGNDGDQLILEGAALYPGEGATLKVSSSTIRSIIGGSGKYAGASGWVESIHHDDGTWEHVFHID
jgi:hypothetical protein